jgi:hypothetical protein
MPEGRLYLDAYGESGRTSTSQPVYATCLLWLPSNDAAIESAFADIRRELGLRQGYEFHARKLTKQQTREKLPERFFEALHSHGLEFQAWCPVMRKSKSRLPPEISGTALFHEMVAQVILRMAESLVWGRTLNFDEQQSGKKPGQSAQALRKHLQQALQREGRGYQLGRVIAKPAHKCAGLQLADFMAAAIVTPWPGCLALLADEQMHTWLT